MTNSTDGGSSSNTTVIVTVITTIGIVVAAILGNYDKIFPRVDPTSTPISSSTQEMQPLVPEQSSTDALPGMPVPSTDTPRPTITPTPDRTAGYYHGAGFGGISISHLQDDIYYMESDPGTWGWTGCGMPWQDKIFGVGNTTNPDRPGLAYTLYISPVGDRFLLKMIYFSQGDGSLLDLESIRIDSHNFDDTVPGDSISGQYPGGISITQIKNNVYKLTSSAQPWGWTGCGISRGNHIFGIARSTHPDGRGLTYTLHITLENGELRENLIYFTNYEGNLVHLPSSIRVDPHELMK